MATKAAYKRLQKEYINLQKAPPPYITAKPLESNILEWHYVLRGPEATPYEGGEYHGKIIFPSDYPYKPPSIRMTTPSGRFKTDTRLCLTMSDFHPSSWNPAWSVESILKGLLSFMASDETTTGSVKTTDTEKRIIASRSHAWNLNNPKFREVWPDLCTPEVAPLPNYQHKLMATNPAQAGQTFARRNVSTPTTEQRQGLATNNIQNAMGQPGWFASTFGQWRRWMFVFVVCIYLLAARVFARAGESV
jgi:ubiquitin-conjugating enzyme E2 J2